MARPSSGCTAWIHGSSLRIYSERERAAWAWTEAVTRVTEGHVSDEVYEKVPKHLTEKELADLTFAIGAINGWNRLNVAARTVPGGYQPAKQRELQKGAISNKHPAFKRFKIIRNGGEQ